MRINTNLSAMTAGRNGQAVGINLNRSLERMSSGLRINRAADDAGGLAVSETMRAQLRGQQQAMRNVQDGLSLIRTADGGLGEVSALLQRGRELAVRAANGVTTVSDRTALQVEVDEFMAEIDRLASATTFNGIPVLSGSSFTDAERQTVVDMVQQQRLNDAWAIVAARYGVTTIAPANTMTVFFDDVAPGGFAAYVSSSGAPPAPTLEMHIDLADFVGMSPDQADRILAHELVHAITFDEMNGYAMPSWFAEGTAEFVHGADDRVAYDLGYTFPVPPLPAPQPTAAQYQALLTPVAGAWGGTSADYSGAFILTKYLHDQVPGGVPAVMQALAADPTLDADDIAVMAGFANEAAFLNEITNGNVAAWAATGGMNLGDLDTGSVAGSDYGNPALTIAGTVPNGAAVLAPNTTPWNIVYAPATASEVIIQEGANDGETLTLALTSISASGLGVATVDLVNAATAAIVAFDSAISQVSLSRAGLGAQANRLEHTMNSLGVSATAIAAAQSRIRDVDMASEASTLTRNQILSQSNLSIQGQANARPARVLSVLLGY